MKFRTVPYFGDSLVEVDEGDAAVAGMAAGVLVIGIRPQSYDGIRRRTSPYRRSARSILLRLRNGSDIEDASGRR
jgi:hypothetical protein